MKLTSKHILLALSAGAFISCANLAYAAEDKAEVTPVAAKDGAAAPASAEAEKHGAATAAPDSAAPPAPAAAEKALAPAAAPDAAAAAAPDAAAAPVPDAPAAAPDAAPAAPASAEAEKAPAAAPVAEKADIPDGVKDLAQKGQAIDCPDLSKLSTPEALLILSTKVSTSTVPASSPNPYINMKGTVVKATEDHIRKLCKSGCTGSLTNTCGKKSGAKGKGFFSTGPVCITVCSKYGFKGDVGSCEKSFNKNAPKNKKGQADTDQFLVDQLKKSQASVEGKPAYKRYEAALPAA